jgi:hypothetical protein
MNGTLNSAVAMNVDELFALACPSREDAPFFNHCMSLAKDMQMTWEEGLRYTIEMRRRER